MHEYTKTTIDGIEYAIYKDEKHIHQFPFIDDADAQRQISEFLEICHIEEVKHEYPDTWDFELEKEANRLTEEVSLEPIFNLPIENTEEI